MAIKTNNKDIQSVMCPAVNNARSEAQAVRIHNGSSWVDVWSSMKITTLLSNTITKGQLYVYTDSFSYHKSLISGVGSLAGGGTMIFYLDGEWTNPTITFDYTGGHIYDSGNNIWHSTTAGSISIYHRAKGATTAGTTLALSRVGVDYTGSDFNYESGSTSKTLSGTFDRLGLSITILNYSVAYTFGGIEMSVRNLKFGSQRVGFPESAEFNYQEY